MVTVLLLCVIMVTPALPMPTTSTTTRPGLACDNVICYNGGTCVGDDIQFSCHCRNGYYGIFCEREDPCKNITCHNGGTCMPTHDGWSAHCLCPGNFTGPYCEEERCLISQIKCDNFRPNETDFEMCRAQVEASFERREQCYQRDIMTAVERRSCACTESDLRYALVRTPPHYEVIGKCLTPEMEPVVVPKCAQETQKCGELMVYLYRNTQFFGVCNETLRASMERCVKMSDEGRLPLENCGAYSYLLQQRDQVLRQLTMPCAGCNYHAVMMKCVDQDLLLNPCRWTPAKLNNTLTCTAEGLEVDEKCQPVSDVAVALLNQLVEETKQYMLPACAKVAEFIEERDKWGCPTAAPSTIRPMGKNYP